MGKLNGKNVIVTGASRGIGREIAKLFASEGGNIICAARTLNEGDHQFEGSLNSTVSEIKSSGGSAISSAVNMGNFLGTKSPPSGAKPFKKTSLNEKFLCIFLVLIYSIPSISIEF